MSLKNWRERMNKCKMINKNGQCEHQANFDRFGLKVLCPWGKIERKETRCLYFEKMKEEEIVGK